MADCFKGLTFSFDEKSSNMYGLYMGWRSLDSEWETGINREVVTSESNMVNHIPNQYGVKYMDNLILEFDIFHQDGTPFTFRESRSINNWFTKETYKKFKVNDYNTDNIYYKAICTSIQDIADGDFYGKHIVLQCDSPFGYTGEITKVVDASDSGEKSWSIINSSDDGVYSPLIHIECSGEYTDNVEMTNLSSAKTMTLNMSDIPIRDSDNKKILDIDSRRMTIRDYAGNLIPLYKVGWVIVPNENSAIPSDEKYWLKFEPGMNKIELKGNAKFKFTMSFPRKVGQLNEQHLPM